MLQLKFFLLTIPLLFIRCDGLNEYTTYPCRFVFNMNTHANSAALRSTVGGTGIFCKVSKTYKGGANYYHFETNQGLSDDVIFTAEDEKTTVALGMKDAIWFGFGNLDIPATFYAYDNQCPNCFDPNAIPQKSRPLTVNSAGLATCSTCRRTYNMNTGGNITSGDAGDKLTRYHASYSSAGVVSVTN